ncbi:MAG: hypothetical protein H7A21_20545 [Spirochaetales bacterium]|nr:hypothetical protein [Spirochaetales bacterium]
MGKGRWRELGMVILLPVSLLQAEEPDSRPFNAVQLIAPEQADRFYLHPVYRSAPRVGSEAGGDRLEGREQNRIFYISDQGLDAAFRLEPISVGLRATLRSEADYRRYGSDSNYWRQASGAGEVLLYGRAGAHALEGPDASPLWATGGEDFRPAIVQWNVGHFFDRLDPEGLLFAGEVSGARALFVLPLASVRLRAGLAGSLLDRELRYKNAGASNHAAFYRAVFGIEGDATSFGILYGFYRFGGRAQKPDLVLPGIPPTHVTVPIGQTALPDHDVHYYGARFGYDGDLFRGALLAALNHGREITVDDAGYRLAVGRRNIRGWMAYGSLGIAGGVERTPCATAGLAGLACLRNGPVREWDLEAAALVSSRDREDGDDDLAGFGSPRPRPGVLGGQASILLSGPEPGRERASFHNFQPGVTFADLEGRSDRSEDRVRDNVDPAPPDYGNEGLRMGSLRIGYSPYDWIVLDLYANYADYLHGDGREGILAVRVPIALSYVRMALLFSATGASYRSSLRVGDPLTGTSSRAPARFYSRYLFGLQIIL